MNKGHIIDADKKLKLSMHGTTKKEKAIHEECLPDYYKKRGGKSAVKSESIGPTSDATAKHSERVYHTVQSWCRNDLPHKQWGWKMSNGMCLPVLLSQDMTPHEHLKIIRCGCKIECYTHCTCTTYGLKCTSIGTGCRRVSCQNYVLSNLNVEV